MKRSYLPSLRPLVAALLLVISAPLYAQAGKDVKDGKDISDSERARRDAEKVFSFIKFHTVKPAAAPAAAPAPAPAPAPARAVARSAPSPAPVSTSAPATTQVVAAAPAPAPTPAAASEALVAAAPAPALSRSAGVPGASQRVEGQIPGGGTSLPAAVSTGLAAPSTAAVLPPPVQAEPEPEPEPEEVPLKLIAYVAPEMNAQILQAMNGPQVVVPVRFTVQPDGVVSAARHMSNSAPRRISMAAVRAVQQWRFDPIPAVREVDVEIAFKATD